jgi:DNA-binding XRE family transcriptional regulator
MALKRLGTEHLIAIKWLSQPNKGGLTDEQIAKECGVTRQTIFNWRKDPLFERELKREMVRFASSRLPEVISNIYDVAIASDNAAMSKLALQLNDMLTEKHEVSNVESSGVDYDSIDAEIESFAKRLEDTDSKSE